MKKIKTLKPNEFMAEFMDETPILQQIFKEGYEQFYIAKLQDLSKNSSPRVPAVRAKTHTLFFLTSGVLIMKIGFYAIKIRSNECVIIPAGQVFSYEEENENEGIMCGFATDFLIGKIGSNELLKTFEFLTIWGNPVIKPPSQIAQYLHQSFERIWDEYALNGLQNTNILQAYLIAALCDLNAIYCPLSKDKNKTAIKLTNQFKELLHQNIHEKHLVTDYASMLNVSSNHLNKMVKLITKKTPSKWIGETLVLEAKVLLLQTNYSISEIASTLGIYDQSYFSRLFKKYVGITPVAFRKMIDMS